MTAAKLFLLLILFLNFKKYSAKKENDSSVENVDTSLENTFSELINYVTGWLEEFNDRNLGNSEIGKLIRYNQLKPKFGDSSREGKNMKKMSMAMLPLVFHVGATSTWMILTSLMAAKSVAIGMALLIFKIAVSSAKVAAFFTSLKSKSHHKEWSWNPHMEHGHVRRFSDGPYLADWNAPDIPSFEAHPYKAIPTYKNHELDAPPFHDEEFAALSKKSHS